MISSHFLFIVTLLNGKGFFNDFRGNFHMKSFLKLTSLLLVYPFVFDHSYTLLDFFLIFKSLFVLLFKPFHFCLTLILWPVVVAPSTFPSLNLDFDRFQEYNESPYVQFLQFSCLTLTDIWKVYSTPPFLLYISFKLVRFSTVLFSFFLFSLPIIYFMFYSIVLR